jgi:hypothetical protein
VDTLNQVPVTDVRYTDPLTLGPKLYANMIVVVQDAPVYARLWVFGDAGRGQASVPLGQWGDEVLLQTSTFPVGNAGGIQFRAVAGQGTPRVTVFAWRPGEPELGSSTLPGPAGARFPAASVPIDTTATVTLVPGIAGLTVTCIGCLLMAAQPVNVGFLSTPGGLELVGPMPLIRATGFVLTNATSWFSAPVGEGIEVTLDAAQQVSGVFVYQQA